VEVVSDDEVSADGAADYEAAMCAEMGQRVNLKRPQLTHFKPVGVKCSKSRVDVPPRHTVRLGSDLDFRLPRQVENRDLTPTCHPFLGFSQMHRFSRYYYGT
jgi:hypothetical protein